MEVCAKYNAVVGQTSWRSGTAPYYCAECNNLLGRIQKCHWVYKRNGLPREKQSAVFVRVIKGEPVAEIFARGLIRCEKCGHEEVWNG